MVTRTEARPCCHSVPPGKPRLLVYYFQACTGKDWADPRDGPVLERRWPSLTWSCVCSWVSCEKLLAIPSSGRWWAVPLWSAADAAFPTPWPGPVHGPSWSVFLCPTPHLGHPLALLQMWLVLNLAPLSTMASSSWWWVACGIQSQLNSSLKSNSILEEGRGLHCRNGKILWTRPS